MMKERQLSNRVMISQRMLIGWAYDPFQSALKVALSDATGRFLASAIADAWLSEAEQIETGLEDNMACGFRIPLPESLLREEMHELTISVANWKLMTDPSPLRFQVVIPEMWQLNSTEKIDEPIKMVAHVDKVDVHQISGFIFDANCPTRMLHLLLLVDQVPVMRIRPNHVRKDVISQTGLNEAQTGIWGFSVSTPISLLDGREHQLSFVCQETGEKLNQAEQRIQFAQLGKTLTNPAVLPVCRAATSQAPIVSIVVLNRNGAKPLNELLNSWCRHNSLPVQWIIVDHASTDDSLSLLNQWSSRLPMQVIALNYNNSFSASCNLGAQQAKAPYVLFLNNDIVWLQDALPSMVATLESQPEVGLVGLKLITQDEGWIEETQHLGIRFGLFGNQYWPYEVSPLTDAQALTHAPQMHPGVTGAVMLCRKADFEALAGFDERYFYGFEDVDISLRMTRDLHKQCLCRNDLVALHRHGYTRLTGREKKVFDRQSHNSALMEKQWGLWLKQQLRQQKWLAHSLWRDEGLRCVLVLDDPNSETGAIQFPQAAQLVRNLNALVPTLQWRMLLAHESMVQLHQVDVLLVFSEWVDIRQAEQLPADTLKVAVLPRQHKSCLWQQQPWWAFFDVQVVAENLLANVPHHWQAWAKQLRVAIRLAVVRAQLIEDHPLLASAQSLVTRLRQEGVSVRIMALDEWHQRDFVQDVVIHVYSKDNKDSLKDLPDVVNLLWALEAPTELSIDAIARFDGVWQASQVSLSWPKALAVQTCFPWQEPLLTLLPPLQQSVKSCCVIDTRPQSEIESVVEVPDYFVPSLARWPAHSATYQQGLLKVSQASFEQGFMPYWVAWAVERAMPVRVNEQVLSGALKQATARELRMQLQQLVESRCGYSVYSS